MCDWNTSEVRPAIVDVVQLKPSGKVESKRYRSSYPIRDETVEHYLHDDILQHLCRQHVDILLELSEEVLNALKDINECVLAPNNVP